ncbi:MAG TPA: Maf family nucleotide pyrophosphatase [Tenuifilaceae bacterium]|nr:Maf family nucleotide pyrophosphatase [Tenuifilaceae bacterium]
MILKDKLNGKKIVLGSKSPRRQQLINQLDIPFEVRVTNDDDETHPEGLLYTEVPEYLAKKKSDRLLNSLKDNEILITSDTIVWCKNRIVGKPESREDAIEILGQLSDDRHEVVTGICLAGLGKTRLFHVSTTIFFRKLSRSEIEYYVDNYRPYDKAGAYGIQEWIGCIGVERIEGSFYNVMGLPLQTLYAELLAFVDG